MTNRSTTAACSRDAASLVALYEAYSLARLAPNRDMSGRPGISRTMLCLDKPA